MRNILPMHGALLKDKDGICLPVNEMIAINGVSFL